jgi:hypothetical protein
MKKILLVLALLLLAICVWPWGGSKDALDLVPKSANSVIITRPSPMLNDPDILSFYNSSQTAAYEIKRVEATTGINETKIDRLVLFFNFDSFKRSNDSYGGFILSGSIDKDRVLQSMRLNNEVTEMSYGNHAFYEVYPKQNPGNMSYFSFLDDSTLVGGTKQAVEDSIDVSSGKLESVKARQKLAQTYGALDKQSLLIFLLDVSPNMKREMNNTPGNQSTSRAFSHIDCMGLSFAKDGKDINIKLLVNTEDAVSANDVSNALGDSLYSLNGIAPRGSTLEKIIKKVNIAAKGNIVTMTLQTTFDELKNLQNELYIPNS